MDAVKLVCKLLLVCVLCFAHLPVAFAQSNATTAGGTITHYAGPYHVGIEWPITGDADHDATCTTEYRVQGSGTWLNALNLIRVNYVDFQDSGVTHNKFAGVVLYLAANTTYEVRLTISDPDGGGTTQTITRTTRAVPVQPTGGDTWHVTAGSGMGGTGTSGNPFQSIEAVEAASNFGPGDVVLMHAGTYPAQSSGRSRFDVDGNSSNYIVWKAAGDGEVILAGGYGIAANYLWFEGIRVNSTPDPTTISYAMVTFDAPTNVVFKSCLFFRYDYSVYLSGGGADWWVEGNTIVGDRFYDSDDFSGEGIELNNTSGHVVMGNTITYTADGISYPANNVFIYRNEIYNVADDGIETDLGGSNTVVLENRLTNTAHNAFSAQPQGGAPWFFVRNQVIGTEEQIFKTRNLDRFVVIHNSFLNWGRLSGQGDSMHLNAYSRNNLWASHTGGQLRNMNEAKSWKTDWNYDGWDWNGAEYPIVYNGTIYYSLSTFQTASGLNPNGVTFNHSTCWPTLNWPNPPAQPLSLQNLTLASGCNVRNAGVVVPNITGSYEGAAPDMGAHEFGSTPPTYGSSIAVPSFSIPPDKPTNFTATGVSATQINFAWTDVSSDETFFRVYISNTEEGPYDTYLDFAANATSGSQTGLTANTTRYYLLYAGNSLGLSGRVVGSGTTTSGGGGGTAPNAPSSLVAARASASSVTVAFTNNGGSATSIVVEKSLDGLTNWTTAATFSGSAVDGTVTGLTPLVRTYFRVKATNAVGSSSYSNTSNAYTALLCRWPFGCS